MLRAVSLTLILFAVWLLLSGHYTGLLLGLGVVSCLLALTIALRMDVVDHEAVPLHLGPHIVLYWLWLIWEIVKANVDVTRRILAPSLRISPTVVRLPALQRTDVGQVVFANSITLTPGTVAIDVSDGIVTVHAISEDGAEALEAGEMNRRVARLEGGQ